MGKQAESVGIAFEMCDVVPESLADLRLQLHSIPLSEECLNGLLATMTERRVAKVMRQACGTHDGAYLREEGVGEFRLFAENAVSHIVTQ